MKKIFLFFSHRLNDIQEKELMEKWAIDRYIYLPNCLQYKWSNIDPHILEIDISPFTGWIEANSNSEDIFLVQGDFGATFKLVTFLKLKGNTVIYSTTERVCCESPDNNDGVKITHRYKHIQFREY
ncbi:MAG: CRISPR-associated protein Csx20 [Candidatus Cloacimonetes bacterium]|nr:CRISPR-associated protein Csx20 [Candidatus Cloacimonadota bacterium]MDD4155335.1 CRISPR-associated protein Csx20 [Candidatus Cloacimonadota bacterium]